METQKDIAKSLHTVSVLVNVCRDFETRHNVSRPEAMKATMEVLGLYGRPDPYGLEEKALRMLGKS